jgi:hypothetical protein
MEDQNFEPFRLSWSDCSGGVPRDSPTPSSEGGYLLLSLKRRLLILCFWRNKCDLPFAYNTVMSGMEEGIIDNRPNLSTSNGSDNRTP